MCTTSYAVPHIEYSDLDGPITFSDLQVVLCRVKNNKAPGLDRIPFEFYKEAPVTFLNLILRLFNDIMDIEVPDSFKKAVIFPLYKKGAVNSVRNYRGISFIDTITKLFTGVLLQRLGKWVEKHSLLNEFQAGFR